MPLSKNEFKLRFTRTEVARGNPLDLIDMRERFDNVAKTFARQAGLILLVCQLKLPCAREHFVNLFVRHRQGNDDIVDVVIRSCRDLCLLLSSGPLKEKVDAETKDIAGPLKSHGFLRLMTRIGILEDVSGAAVSRNALQLGVTGGLYKIVARVTDPLRQAVQHWLDLHDTVHCIMILGAPNNLSMWDGYCKCLSHAFKRHAVLGLSRGDGYCVEWLNRTFLDSLLFSQDKAPLEVGADVPLTALPGPDEKGCLATISEMFPGMLAMAVLKDLNFQKSPHLFAMIACFMDWGPTAQKRRKTRSIPVAGHHIMFKNVPYQSFAQFFLHTCKLSSVLGRKVTTPHQPVAKAVAGHIFAAGEKVILKDVSPHSYSSRWASLVNGETDAATVPACDGKIIAWGSGKYNSHNDITLFSVPVMIKLAADAS